MLQRAEVKAERRSMAESRGRAETFAASLGKEPRDLLFTHAQFILLLVEISVVRDIAGQEVCHGFDSATGRDWLSDPAFERGNLQTAYDEGIVTAFCGQRDLI
jgi:hypothetical protein